MATAFSDSSVPIIQGRDLPSVYDAIYRASISYGMTTDMTSLLVKLLASTVDLQAQVKPNDTIGGILSAADEKGRAGPNSELLYVNARFGDTFVLRASTASRMPTTFGRQFDHDGKSIRQFLLRNPVPNGRMDL